MRCILGLLTLFAVSAWIKAGVLKKASGGNTIEDKGDLTVTEQPEQANNHLNRNQDGIVINGGIAMSRPSALRNAIPCTLHDNMWPNASDGKVYIPYVIANHYSSQQLDIIKKGISSFSYSTCVRFFPRTHQRDFLYIQSLDGCRSCVGRQGNAQTVSLSRQACIFYGTVQHELLHALGFSHEQCRSDRDQYIEVLLQNVVKGREHNFDKINTLNQKTPYDYSSVMHYSRLSFSKDHLNPTMVAVPDPTTVFGAARQMSQSDIDRINLLYCKN